jgi:hypothetical protein
VSKVKDVSEHHHQVAVINWAKLMERKWPELRWLHAIPNGGQRNVIVAKKLKAEGVRKGVSDLFLPVARRGFHGLYIEMKRLKGSPTDEQSHFIAFALEQGYHAGVYHGWEAAIQGIEHYMGGE